MTLFKNRTEAGQQLAAQLEKYAGRSGTIVLGLPRGGVPVAFEVASALDLPLDIWLVRKLSLPGYEELALGAIAAGGRQVLNRNIIEPLDISDELIERITDKERQVLNRREQVYRANKTPPQISGRNVILVDDGLATGATMRAAVKTLRTEQPRQIIVAVPTASPQTCAEFEDEVDRIVCAHTPQPFQGVGAWYEDFTQITDDDVRAILQKAASVTPASKTGPNRH